MNRAEAIAINGAGITTDFITVLTHSTLPLSKRWRADGSIEGFGLGKHFSGREIPVADFTEMAATLAALHTKPRSCVIRGRFTGEDLSSTVRQKDVFADTEHHWLLIDVDKYQPLEADPVLEPVESIEQYIHEHLPPEFHDASYHWQLSSSAGHPTKQGLRAHLWFWSETPHTSATLRAWGEPYQVDLSLFNEIQVHYTAAPVYDKGVADPVPLRSGTMRKASDVVQLTAAPAAPSERPSRQQVARETLSTDPVAQLLYDKGLVKSERRNDLGLNIECPCSDRHTGDSGETSTVYYPAYTGGYAQRAFVCQHDHCRGTPQSDFLAALGYEEPSIADDFDDVPADNPDWPELLPIPDDLPAVPPFDLALLPDVLRPWIADIADRMQISPDIPAIGAVTALSAAVGRRVQIMPKAHDDWTVVPNLWGMVVAPPGYMKSPALSEVMKPLHLLEREAHREYEAARAAWEAEKQRMAIINAAAKSTALTKLKKDPSSEIVAPQPEPDEPVATRYCINNFSLEALGEVLMGNPLGVLAFSDEVHGLLMMAQKPGNEGLNDFLLSAWNGDGPFTFDRIGRGLNRRIDHVCVAVLGGIQPGRLVEHVTGATHGGAGDSGLVQRFQLLTWPDLCEEWHLVDRKPNREAQTAAYQVFERLTARADAGCFGTDDEEDAAEDIRRFDLDAQEAFYAWLKTLEQELRVGQLSPVMASHLSKYRSLVPSLALIFAVADNVQGAIPLRYLHQAIGWADYLRPHAERVYACTTRPDTRHARALLNKIRTGAIADDFTPRDVYLKGWSLLDRDGVTKAVDLLSDLGYLRSGRKQQQPGGGRPSISYRINPHAKG